MDKARLHLKLLDYLNHDWKSEYHIKPNQQDISFISFTCVTEIEKTDLDIAIHVTYNTGQTVMAFHSPYWMVNKTGRMLQYKADGIHRKHPPNYKKPVLFSFQPKHFFNNNKVCEVFLTFILYLLITPFCLFRRIKYYEVGRNNICEIFEVKKIKI